MRRHATLCVPLVQACASKYMENGGALRYSGPLLCFGMTVSLFYSAVWELLKKNIIF